MKRTISLPTSFVVQFQRRTYDVPFNFACDWSTRSVLHFVKAMLKSAGRVAVPTLRLLQVWRRLCI